MMKFANYSEEQNPKPALNSCRKSLQCGVVGLQHMTLRSKAIQGQVGAILV